MAKRLTGLEKLKWAQEHGNVIHKWMIGNTRIIIMDTYAAKTEEETKKVLDRLAEHAKYAYLKYGEIEDVPFESYAPMIDIGVDGDFNEFRAKYGMYDRETGRYENDPDGIVFQTMLAE